MLAELAKLVRVSMNLALERQEATAAISAKKNMSVTLPFQVKLEC